MYLSGRSPVSYFSYQNRWTYPVANEMRKVRHLAVFLITPRASPATIRNREEQYIKLIRKKKKVPGIRKENSYWFCDRADDIGQHKVEIIRGLKALLGGGGGGANWLTEVVEKAIIY